MKEEKRNHPKTLADLISLAESSGNEFAVRFEPKHRPSQKYIHQMANITKSTFVTSEILCSISWGEFQIMGDTLIELGLTVTPFDYLNDPKMQLSYFYRFVNKYDINFALEEIINNRSIREKFAAKYNGPEQVDEYSDYLIRVYNS